MRKLFPIIILAACSLVALGDKPRVKKATKKTVVTHQKKQTATKRDTIIIKFNPNSVADALEDSYLFIIREHTFDKMDLLKVIASTNKQQTEL